MTFVTTVEPSRPTISRKACARRVKLGARLLDNIGPDDWFHNVDVDALSTQAITRCVGAQVFGAYWTAKAALFGSTGTAVIEPTTNARAHGFDAYGGHPREWEWLDRAWANEIIKRRHRDLTAPL